MTHFGKPKVGGKFYYGDPRDTPWNRDLLWVKFVNKEETDMTRPLDERAGRTFYRYTHHTQNMCPCGPIAVVVVIDCWCVGRKPQGGGWDSETHSSLPRRCLATSAAMNVTTISLCPGCGRGWCVEGDAAR